ncbi:MAG: hypothetical protein ACYCXA_00800 [Actinomycetes bacterium]
MSTPDPGSLLDAVRGVPGVAQVEWEPEADPDNPGALRLLLEAGADEVAVATAVNRLLRDRFGLAVDVDRVRVVEETVPAAAGPLDTGPLDTGPLDTGPLDTGPAPAPAPSSRQPRLTIERLQLVSEGLGVTVTVTLGLQGRQSMGHAAGAASATGVHRAVAEATLEAVAALVGEQVRLEVEHVEVVTNGAERTVVVVAALLTSRGATRLSGSSVVREDVRQAVLRASLAAVNRRVAALLAGPGG